MPRGKKGTRKPAPKSGAAMKYDAHATALEDAYGMLADLRRELSDSREDVDEREDILELFAKCKDEQRAWLLLEDYFSKLKLSRKDFPGDDWWDAVAKAKGKKRLIMWSGLYPARLAVSEDDGAKWSELKPAGDWGGIVVMGCLEELKTGKGHYMAMFHDDGRFFAKGGKRGKPVVFNLYKTFSKDGGLTWSKPESIFARSDVHLCEPGIIRSPDGKQLCVLLRENSRRKNSFVIFSNDEGNTWTKPRELPAALTGDRHTGKYTADGRLFISFRDLTHESTTKGDWVAWVGTYDDIVKGREGQYRVRLMDNTKGADCAYPPVEVLPDDTIVTTTYGHWTKGESPYIVSVRLKLSELDAMAKKGEVLK